MPSEEWFDSLTKESKQAYLSAEHKLISQHQDRTTVTSTSIYSSKLSDFIQPTMCKAKAPITKSSDGYASILPRERMQTEKTDGFNPSLGSHKTGQFRVRVPKGFHLRTTSNTDPLHP